MYGSHLPYARKEPKYKKKTSDIEKQSEVARRDMVTKMGYRLSERGGGGDGGHMRVRLAIRIE